MPDAGSPLLPIYVSLSPGDDGSSTLGRGKQPFDHSRGGKPQVVYPRRYKRRDGLVEWRDRKERLERADGPAVEIPAGVVWPSEQLGPIEGPAELYFSEGQLHRADGPAVVRGGSQWLRQWFWRGKPHRTDGPAYEDADGVIVWLRDGAIDRTDGPALDVPAGARFAIPQGSIFDDNYSGLVDQQCRAWVCAGIPHRRNAPALESEGLVIWFHEGELHREGGPAVEVKRGEWEDSSGREWRAPCQLWWRHGQLHRDDGPAVVVHSEKPDQYWREDQFVRYGLWNLPFECRRLLEFAADHPGSILGTALSRLSGAAGRKPELVDAFWQLQRWGLVHHSDGLGATDEGIAALAALRESEANSS
jgi:hypothetical protein